MRSWFERCSADIRHPQQCSTVGHFLSTGIDSSNATFCCRDRLATALDICNARKNDSFHTLVVVGRVHCSVSGQFKQHGVHAVVQLLSASALEVRAPAPPDQQCIACVRAWPHAACVRLWRHDRSIAMHYCVTHTCDHFGVSMQPGSRESTSNSHMGALGVGLPPGLQSNAKSVPKCKFHCRKQEHHVPRTAAALDT